MKNRGKISYPKTYRSKKIPGGKGICRSPVERKIFKELDGDDRVNRYTPEPLKIPYRHRDRDSTYTPDVLIEFKDGSKDLVEIKAGTDEAAYYKNVAKFRAAEKFAEQSGLKFRLWTPEKKWERWQDAQAAAEQIRSGIESAKLAKGKNEKEDTSDPVFIVLFWIGVYVLLKSCS